MSGTITIKIINDPQGNVYFEKDSLLAFLRIQEIIYLRNDKIVIANYIKSLIERIMAGTEIKRKE